MWCRRSVLWPVWASGLDHCPFARRFKMKRTPIIVAASAVVLGAAWALFRPELLFVKKQVNETFPVASAAAVMAPHDTASTPELTGQFHKGAHDTKGTA